MHIALPRLILPLLLGLTAIPAEAKLYAVDNDKANYTAANGFFAAWYQDIRGQALDLCLSPVKDQGGGFMCNLLPSDTFNPEQPVAFPTSDDPNTNFPGEAFWFAATTTIVANRLNLSYNAALEAAFSGGEVPVDGQQVSFARIRIRVTVPEPGTYTITHPYGVDVFEVNALTGSNEINMTRDIGLGSPKDFSGALKGDIGPFLRSVKAPYTVGGESFIGDPNALDEVTGSPFGTNFVRIDGPNGLHVETKVFSVTGKLSDNKTLSTPLIIERATYSTNSADKTVQQDFFTQAPPAPATQTYNIDGTGGSTAMLGNDTSAWYGQAWYDQASAPLSPEAKVFYTADNSPVSTPTTKSAPLVDMVTISRAEYSLTTHALTVEASSSDQIGQPVLTVEGLGAPIELAAGTKTFPVSTPPATVQVRSTSGGVDSEEIAIIP